MNARVEAAGGESRRAARLLPRLGALVLAAALLAPRSAAAERLRVDWPLDGAVVLLAGGGWIASEALKDRLAPAGCRWCARNDVDDAVTRALAWKDIEAADSVGSAAAFAVAPAAALSLLALASSRDGRLREAPEDALIVVEAVALSSALNQIVKFSVGRERPFVADTAAEDKTRTASPADNDLSFYSGHSNLAFALAVSAGTIAHLRGYSGEPYVWAVGIPLAGFVAYSRIAAKKHYLTDVLIGSAAGAAIGFVVPYFLHRAKPADSDRALAIALAPMPNGASLTFVF